MADRRGIPNSDYVPDPFPGIYAPSGTGAMGSAGDRTLDPSAQSLDFESGMPNTGVVQSVSGMADPGSDSTIMPGQNDGFYDTGYSNTSTGAGDGVSVSASSHGRLSYQDKGTDD